MRPFREWLARATKRDYDYRNFPTQDPRARVHADGQSLPALMKASSMSDEPQQVKRPAPSGRTQAYPFGAVCPLPVLRKAALPFVARKRA